MIEEKIIEFAERLESALVQAAPGALELAEKVIRVEALSNLFWGGVFVSFAGVSYKCFKLMSDHCKKQGDAANKVGGINDWYIGQWGSYCLNTFSTGILAGQAVSYLFNIWYWVALVSPKLYLAKLALMKVLH